MALFEVESVATFEKIRLESPGGVVAHFWAAWAPQCEQMNEVMLELAKINTSVKFIKIEAESLPELSHQHNISAVPTFILFKNGSAIDRLDGASAPDLTKKIKQLSSAIVIPEAPIIKQDLNERLKIIINTAPCMLFMKGTPAEPKCGFSKQVIGILNDHDISFSSFNILSDDEVRQGLKTYSNWPTFPQFYINGELIGGLDIIKEMVANGELLKAVPKKEHLDNRLKALINKSSVMLFMKGNRENPRCGFSKQTIAILNEISIPYETFDILMDEEIRQGLKTFSNWPTYPQLYVKGELIGGLDIIKELNDNGELKSTLQP